MSVAFRITAPRGSFVAGEDVLFDLVIENRGNTPIEVPDPEANANWQPSYTLAGPGPKDARTFDLRAIVRGSTSGVPADDEAVLVTIAPGAAWQGSLPLTDLVKLPGPGTYTLTARLTWRGVDVAADPVTFTVEPLRLTAANVGVSAGPGGAPEVFAAWVHEAAGKAAIFQAQFVEKRPDLGEMARRGVARLCEPAPGARDVTSPSADHSRFDDLFGWAAWREGRDVLALPTTGVGAGRVSLGFEPSLVLQPSLAARSHDLEIFVVGGGALGLIRFQDRGYAGPPAGTLVWTMPIQAPVVSGAVARAPGGVRHVVLVAPRKEQVEVLHVVADGAKPPAKAASIELDGCAAIADAPPGLVANARGGVRAGLFVVASDDARKGRVVEVLLGPADPRDRAAATTVVPLPAPPVAARVGYFRHPGGGYRRDFVVLDAGGALHARGDAGVRVARTDLDRTLPLNLVVLSQASYLLEPSAAGGLGLEAIE